VRAAEVELHAVRARVGERFMNVVPVLARIGHQRGDDRVVRPALLALGDLAEVGLGRTVADELDVVEADHAHLPWLSATSNAS
jgi:hypothetical protein